jgi:acid stress chaperone HdeA
MQDLYIRTLRCTVDFRGLAPSTEGETVMKPMHILIPVLLAGVAAPAAAETKTSAAEIKKPVTEWTCREFIALGDQYKPNAVYWASAYAKGGEPEASELDIAGTEQITPGIVQDCEREPESSFWQKLKAAWEKVEADAKKMEKKM